MTHARIRANEAQKNGEPVRPPGHNSVRQHLSRTMQQAAPDAPYRHTQVNRIGLRPADFLTLQRTVGNREVLRVATQRTANADDSFVLAKHRLTPLQQDRVNLVIQRMKVGDNGASAAMLAAKHFNESNELWKAALDVLKQMEKAGTDYKSVEEIIQAVEADPKVKQERAAANVQRAAQEAEEKEKAESPELYDYGRDGILTEYHIKKGTWQRIPDRAKPDYELITTLGGYTYSFHVHPPQFSGRRPIAGQVMRDGRMTNTDTPNIVIDFIIKAKSLPAGW